MLYAFTMSVEAAMEFYRRAELIGASSEEERHAILMEMVQEGLINGVVATKRSKEQYISDLAKNFSVLNPGDYEDGDED